MKVVREPQLEACWRLSLYPTAGEAGGSFHPTARRISAHVARGSASNPERARVEAARRARSKVRRYCAHNGISRLGTLTYAGAGVFDHGTVRAHLGVFFKNLRHSLGGEPLPYVWVPEWHKNHGLHAHFGVARYIKKRTIDEAWGRGWVSIKYLSDRPVGSSNWQESRRAAGYLSKYVTKAFERHEFTRHRYDLAQGFQPPIVTIEDRTADLALDQAIDLMGGVLPERSWNSADTLDWQGPPAVWHAWA